MTTALKIIDIPNMAGVLTVLLEDLHELETKDNLFENVATIIDEVDDALMNAQSKLQEIKKEEIVEEVKPKLRRETFENSSLLRQVGLTKLWNQYFKQKQGWEARLPSAAPRHRPGAKEALCSCLCRCRY